MSRFIVHCLVYVGVLSLVPFLMVGCGEVECGDGTYQVAGECHPVDDKIQIVKCGTGLKLSGGQCVPEDKWVEQYCDPKTAKFDPKTGLCVGTGGGTVQFCTETDYKCPTAQGGTVCISGRVYVEKTLLEKGTKDAVAIKLKTEKAKVVVYDPIAFSSDPKGTQPLAEATSINDDGCFIVPKVNIPYAGFFAVGAVDAGTANTFVLAGTGVAATAGNNLEGIAIPAFKKATLSAWSKDAGGEDLVNAGLAIIQYVSPAGFVSGVVPLQAKAEPANWTSGEVFYLNPDLSTSPVINKSATSTSSIGVVMIRKGEISTYSGKKANCNITEGLIGTAPGSLLFVTFTASGTGC